MFIIADPLRCLRILPQGQFAAAKEGDTVREIL
jgi:hypothetical protein